MKMKVSDVLRRNLHELTDRRVHSHHGRLVVATGTTHHQTLIDLFIDLDVAMTAALHDPSGAGRREDRSVVGTARLGEYTNHPHPQRVGPGEIKDLPRFGHDLVVDDDPLTGGDRSADHAFSGHREISA